MGRFYIMGIAIWAIIQSLIYMTLSIMADRTHRCQYDMDSNKFVYLIYLIYFRAKACGHIMWDNLGITIPENRQPIIPDVAAIASRMNRIAIWYIALSLLWLITSIILLVGAIGRFWGKLGYLLMYVPWLIIAICNIILDVISVIVFTRDAGNTNSVAGLLEVLEIEDHEFFREYLDDLVTVKGVLLTIPSIIFLLISARLIIIWIYNVISVFKVGFTGYKLQTKDSDDKKG